MAAKRQPKPDDPAQSKRFIEAAKQADTDDNPEAFERVFKRVTSAPKRDKPG